MLAAGENEARKVFAAPNLSEANLFLMKMKPELLEAMQQGNRICIKGREDDEAVLCTPTETYEMKAADTSNTVMVANLPVGGTQMVQGLTPYAYELRKVPPRISRVREMLDESMYIGPDDEHLVRGRKYTRRAMTEVVQASDGELDAFLATLNVVEIDGYLRLLDDAYFGKVADLVLTTAVAEGWEADGVPEEACQASLEEFHVLPQVVTGVLKGLGTAAGDRKDSRQNVYVLDSMKVARFRALQLLECSKSQKWSYDEFVAVWGESLPDGVTPDLSLLEACGRWGFFGFKGYVLVEETSLAKTIERYCVADLPVDAQQRFAELFRKRSHWKGPDILPFVKDLCAKGEKVEALLLKHARCMTDPKTGIKIYNTRYGVK